MKIASKINISFFVVVAILIAIAMSIFYMAGKSNLQKAIYAHLSTTAHSRAHHIETFLKTQKNAAIQLSKSITLEEFLSAGKENPDYIQRFNRAMRKLEATEKVNEFTFELFVIDKNGKIAASSDRSKIGLDRSTDSYFLGGKKGPYIKDAHYSNTMAEECLVFSAPIEDSNTGEFLGVIVARIRLDMLNEITTDRTGLGETGEIYLVNKYGYMITPSRFRKDAFLKQKVDTENTRKYFEHIKKFVRKPHPHEPLMYRDYRGIKVLGLHDHIYDMQWCLCAEIDKQEALAPLVIIKLTFIIIFCTVLGTVWTIGTLVSRVITAPIYRLQKGIEIIGKGNLDYKVGTDVKDEIGLLSRAFDEMATDLKKTTTSISNLNQEITQRVKAEEALCANEAQLSNAMKIANLGYWEYDVADDQFTFNDHFYDIFHTTAKQVGGYKMKSARYAELFLHPDDRQVVAIETKKALETTDPQYSRQLEHRIVYATGEIGYISVRFVIVKDKQGRTIKTFGANQDITDRKQAELKQVELFEKVENVNRELKDFASIVSHDLKAPLRGIKTLANWILSDSENKLGDGAIEQMNLLLERVERMYNLIEGVLQYSIAGRAEGKRVQVNLNNFVPEIINMVVPPENITVTIEDELPVIECEEVHVMQIFQNLLSNAIKYMDRPQGWIKVGCVEQDGFWKFSIADNGPGIEEKHFEKIFKIFQALPTSPDFQGTGVGLTVAKKIVELYDGRIWVESKPGEGSTFFFTLPKSGALQEVSIGTASENTK